MPTPSDNTLHEHTPVGDLHHDRLTHTTCPPDIERVEAWRSHDRNSDGDLMDHDSPVNDAPPQQQAEPSSDVVTPGPMDTNDNGEEEHEKMVDIEQEHSSTDSMSPTSVTAEVKEGEQRLSPAPIVTAAATSSSYSSMSHEFSNVRVCAIHTGELLSIEDANVGSLAISQPYILVPPRGQQISRHSTIGPPSLQSRGRYQACRYERVFPVRVSTDRRYVFRGDPSSAWTLTTRCTNRPY